MGDGALQRHHHTCRIADIAHSGKACQQGGFQIVDAVDFLVEGSAGHQAAYGVAGVEALGNVDVAINQARRHKVLRQVDHLDPGGRRLIARFYRHNPVVVDAQRHLLVNGLIQPIKQPPGMHHIVLCQPCGGRKGEARRTERQSQTGAPWCLISHLGDSQAAVAEIRLRRPH